MDPNIIIGLLLGFTVTLLITVGVLVYTMNQRDKRYQVLIQKSEDRARGAELRSDKQIDALLDRVRTSERLEIREPAPALPDPEERAYISDFTYDDDSWNDLREEAASAAKEPAE